MKINAMGINTRHETGLNINRPVGSGDCLLLIFKSPAYVVTNGVRYDVLPDQAVLFAEGMPQIYGNDKLYINHWVHFECSEKDALFDDMQMQFGIPVPVALVSSAESILEMLGAEKMSDRRNDKAEDLLIRLLLVRTFSTPYKQKNPHSEILRKIRSDIYATPAGDHSVKSMSEKANISSTYFQTLYKNEFGVSIGEDVIRSRIAAAEYYLKNTELTITEIADICGYKNIEHFIRQFRLRTHMTASEFREIYR